MDKIDTLIERLDRIQKKVDKILENDLYTLPYFNDINYQKNKKTLKKYIFEEPIADNHSIGIYDSYANIIGIDSNLIFDETTDEELIVTLLHEHIHMASTDLERHVVGFNNEALPFTYNEAATQYLALKLYYNNMDIAFKNNKMYNESVIKFYNVLNEIGECTIYNGFFEADSKKNATEMTPNQKQKWLDYILSSFNTNEEVCTKHIIDSYINKKQK